MGKKFLISPEKLAHYYLSIGSINTIAQELNCSPTTILKYLKEYDIPRRNRLEAVMLGRNLSPNKPERQLNKLLKGILPNEYKFVGDGKLIIAGFCPDFVNCNGQKKIIELYGDYWHSRQNWKKRDKRRIIAYNRLGYKTLIIWQHELKNREKVKERILEFNK